MAINPTITTYSHNHVQDQYPSSPLPLPEFGSSQSVYYAVYQCSQRTVAL